MTDLLEELAETMYVDQIQKAIRSLMLTKTQFKDSKFKLSLSTTAFPVVECSRFWEAEFEETRPKDSDCQPYRILDVNLGPLVVVLNYKEDENLPENLKEKLRINKVLSELTTACMVTCFNLSELKNATALQKDKKKNKRKARKESRKQRESKGDSESAPSKLVLCRMH